MAPTSLGAGAASLGEMPPEKEVTADLDEEQPPVGSGLDLSQPKLALSTLTFEESLSYLSNIICINKISWCYQRSFIIPDKLTF